MSEAEMVGAVVLALVTILGLFFTVAKPLAANTRQMTELSMQIKNLSELYDRHEEEFEKQILRNSDAHKRLWNHSVEQDQRLDNHEIRLTKLEGQV